MNELLIFIQSLPTAMKTGLIYSIMVMGVYITYKILDFPDLSVDGTFPLGGFIFAAFSLSPNGFFGITNPIIGLIFATIGGIIAGYITGALHVYFDIEGLLSGILVGTGLHSINFRINSSSNAIIPGERSLYEMITYEKYFIIFTVVFVLLLILKGFYDYKIKENKYVIRTMIVYVIIFILLEFYVVSTQDIKLMLTALIVFIIKMIIDYILTSKFGFALRALGNNEQLVVSLGVNEKRLKIFGLMISNGLVALSGALFAQDLKVADLQSGVGTIVVGLAAIILGLGVLKKSRMVNEVSIIIVGSLLYYCIVNMALMSNNWTQNLYRSLNINENITKILEVKSTDTKVITSVILGIILWNEYRKKSKYKTFFSELGTEKEVFKNLNLEINDGDFITIIGSNGAGKSTLLNVLNGQIMPDKGTVMLNDINLTNVERHKRAKWISQVYQNPSQGTAPSMTVLENLSMAKNKGKKFNFTFGLDVKNLEFYKKQLQSIGLGLENQLFTQVELLSGGQRQCLSLIMATLNQPDILLLDEHTAALDPQTSSIILNKTKEIIEKNNITSLMITHNMQDAINYGNRLIMLHAGEIIFDIKGEEKKHLTVEKLLEMFKTKDAMLSDKDVF